MVCTYFCPQRDLLNVIFSRKICFLQFVSHNRNAQINRICYINRQSDLFVCLFWLGGWGGGSDRKCVIKCSLSTLCLQFFVILLGQPLYESSLRVCLFLHMCMYTDIHTDTHPYTCVYTYRYTHTHAYTHRFFTYVYSCIHIHVQINMHIHIHLHVHIHVEARDWQRISFSSSLKTGSFTKPRALWLAKLSG